MRWRAGLLALVLAGCGQRQDFDARYADTANAIAARAAAIDANVAQARNESAPAQ